MLLERAQKLEDFAYASEQRNRLIGTPGHNDTINYIYDTLNALDGYYDVELQPFDTLVQESGDFAFSVGDQAYETAEMEFSPSGDVTAPLVVVNNLGCEAVSKTLNLTCTTMHNLAPRYDWRQLKLT